MNTLSVHTDGGARGNPGPAAVGVVFQHEGGQQSHERYIGEATNNVAEYTAVLDALEKIPSLLNDHPFETVVFYLDSQLIVRQILGEYKVREPHLAELCNEVRHRLSVLGISYRFIHIPRAENAAADKLVNHALDNR